MNTLKSELESCRSTLKKKPHSFIKRKELEEERHKRYLENQESRISKRAIPEHHCEVKLERQPSPNIAQESNTPTAQVLSPKIKLKIDEVEPYSSIPALELNKEEFASTHLFISAFFKNLLSEWNKVEIQGETQNLFASEASNPDIAGQIIKELQPRVRDRKFLSEIYLQTTEHMKYFFLLLQESESQDNDSKIPNIVHDLLLEIIECLQRREYVQANDAYIRLSIGNAPWPIGVTMVCIHERSAREKIHSNQVAHVLNDERQRKWIQSIKRLISFCQRAYPPSRITQALG